MSPERAELIKSLKTQIAYEQNFRIKAFSDDLKIAVIDFLKTVGSRRQGCKMIGFNYHTAKHWAAQTALAKRIENDKKISTKTR